MVHKRSRSHFFENLRFEFIIYIVQNNDNKDNVNKKIVFFAVLFFGNFHAPNSV